MLLTMPSLARAEEALALVQQAQSAYQRADYRSAIQLVERAQTHNPNWHELEFNLAVIAEAAENYGAATAHYRSYALYLPPEASLQVRSHADQLEDHQRRLNEPPKKGGLPWWGWMLVVVGGLAVLGAAGQAAGAEGT
jgi:tetratricopeptide (TPR) repeat protein